MNYKAILGHGNWNSWGILLLKAWSWSTDIFEDFGGDWSCLYLLIQSGLGFFVVQRRLVGSGNLDCCISRGWHTGQCSCSVALGTFQGDEFHWESTHDPLVCRRWCWPLHHIYLVVSEYRSEDDALWLHGLGPFSPLTSPHIPLVSCGYGCWWILWESDFSS